MSESSLSSPSSESSVSSPSTASSPSSPSSASSPSSLSSSVSSVSSVSSKSSGSSSSSLSSSAIEMSSSLSSGSSSSWSGGGGIWLEKNIYVNQDTALIVDEDGYAPKMDLAIPAGCSQLTLRFHVRDSDAAAVDLTGMTDWEYAIGMDYGEEQLVETGSWDETELADGIVSVTIDTAASSVMSDVAAELDGSEQKDAIIELWSNTPDPVRLLDDTCVIRSIWPEPDLSSSESSGSSGGSSASSPTSEP